jgi:hypothetical protein
MSLVRGQGVREMGLSFPSINLILYARSVQRPSHRFLAGASGSEAVRKRGTAAQREPFVGNNSSIRSSISLTRKGRP